MVQTDRVPILLPFDRVLRGGGKHPCNATRLLQAKAGRGAGSAREKESERDSHRHSPTIASGTRRGPKVCDGCMYQPAAAVQPDEKSRFFQVFFIRYSSCCTIDMTSFSLLVHIICTEYSLLVLLYSSSSSSINSRLSVSTSCCSHLYNNSSRQHTFHVLLLFYSITINTLLLL